MASTNVAGRSASAELKQLLDSPEIAQLISELEATRWTGRPGYPIRALTGMALSKSLYAIPTWTKTVALVREHWALQRALGCEGEVPSVYSCYRYAEKLRAHGDKLERCIDSVVKGLRSKLPSYGTDLSIDASDMPAYANGQRYVSKDSEVERNWHTDPDASWGHRSAVSTRRGGGFFGYRLHAAVCSATGLPVAWTVETAKANESRTVAGLLDAAKRRGAIAATAAMDKGYDVGPVYEDCADRDCLPIIPLRQTPAVKRGDHLPPSCAHGEWKFAGSDRKRGASKWRCPTGKCKPASTWIVADRLHPLVPRETKRWKALYRGRASVEREFGALKHNWGLKPLRARGLSRVRLHADLTILTKLACTLSRVRASTRSRSGRAGSPPPAPTPSRSAGHRGQHRAPLRS